LIDDKLCKIKFVELKQRCVFWWWKVKFCFGVLIPEWCTRPWTNYKYSCPRIKGRL